MYVCIHASLPLIQLNVLDQTSLPHLPNQGSYHVPSFNKAAAHSTGDSYNETRTHARQPLYSPQNLQIPFSTSSLLMLKRAWLQEKHTTQQTLISHATDVHTTERKHTSDVLWYESFSRGP